MCQGRGHTYRLTLTLSFHGGTQKETDLVVRAQGIGPAFCQADAWAQTHYPEAQWVTFKSHRASYRDRAAAEEHGADYRQIDENARYLAECERRATEAKACSYAEALELQV